MRRRCRGLRYGIWTGLFGLICGLSASVSARAEAPETARWIGGDAAIYLESRHPARLLDRLLDERLQKALRAVPPYAKAVESPGFRKVRDVVETLAGKLDTTWEQGLRDLTGGGIVAAVEGAPPRVVVVITPSNPSILKRASGALLDLAREDAANRGNPDPVKSAEYRGFTGYTVGKGAYAIVEGKLVLADRPEALKAVIDRVLDGAGDGGSIADNATWKARREKVGDEALVWGLARLDRLRVLDPKKFAFKKGEGENDKPQATLLFGSWLEAIRKADWVSASVNWTEDRLGAELALPTPAGGYSAALKGFVPSEDHGAVAPLVVPGTVASLSLWRDLASIWEARAELFTPEVVQGFAKLDGVAGQFFGGRDFGTGVLGALGNDWRLVVARQDYPAMKPVPDVKLPAFALIADLKPDDDDDFAQRLKVAFQSFVGLANLGAAQSKAPPLELQSETCDGVTIATTRFMLPKAGLDPKEPVHLRHNFSPSIVQVDNHFVLSSSVGLTRDLVRALKAPGRRDRSTVLAEADGPELARILDLNKGRLVMQNMLEKGHDKVQAEQEVSLLLHLLRLVGHGRLAVEDGADTVRLGLNFDLSR